MVTFSLPILFFDSAVLNFLLLILGVSMIVSVFRYIWSLLVGG